MTKEYILLFLIISVVNTAYSKVCHTVPDDDIDTKDIKNFMITGTDTCKITCAEIVSIIVTNVTNFRLEM